MPYLTIFLSYDDKGFSRVYEIYQFDAGQICTSFYLVLLPRSRLPKAGKPQYPNHNTGTGHPVVVLPSVLKA